MGLAAKNNKCAACTATRHLQYTEISSAHSPLQVLGLLGVVYRAWDAMCDEHGLYKVGGKGKARGILKNFEI